MKINKQDVKKKEDLALRNPLENNEVCVGEDIRNQSNMPTNADNQHLANLEKFYYAIKSVMRANGKSSVVTSDEINEVINEFEDLEEKG